MKNKTKYVYVSCVCVLVSYLCLGAKALASDDPNYYNFRAVRHYQKGEIGLAISVLDSGLKTIGGHATLLNNRAFFKWKQGEYYNAIDDLKTALNHDPYTQLKKLIYLNLGRSYFGLNHYEAAIFYLTLALDITPDFVPALQLRARAKMQSAELDLNAIK